MRQIQLDPIYITQIPPFLLKLEGFFWIERGSKVCFPCGHIGWKRQVLVDPFPLAVALLRDTCTAEGGIKRCAPRCSPRVLAHGRKGRILGQSCNFDIFKLHITVVPVREDCVKVIFKLSPDCIAEHIIAQHLIKIVETTRSYHPVVEIGARLFVPVVQPAFIQLLKNLLFLLFEIWVVVLGHTTISFHDSTFAGYLWQRFGCLPCSQACAGTRKFCRQRYTKPVDSWLFIKCKIASTMTYIAFDESVLVHIVNALSLSVYMRWLPQNATGLLCFPN